MYIDIKSEYMMIDYVWAKISYSGSLDSLSVLLILIITQSDASPTEYTRIPIGHSVGIQHNLGYKLSQ
jgi:hypothetical protein